MHGPGGLRLMHGWHGLPRSHAGPGSEILTGIPQGEAMAPLSMAIRPVPGVGPSILPSPLWSTYCGVNEGVWLGSARACNPASGEEPLNSERVRTTTTIVTACLHAIGSTPHPDLPSLGTGWCAFCMQPGTPCPLLTGAAEGVGLDEEGGTVFSLARVVLQRRVADDASDCLVTCVEAWG